MFVSSEVLKDGKISEFHDIAFLFWFVDHFVALFLREWYLYFDSMNWILVMH